MASVTRLSVDMHDSHVCAVRGALHAGRRNQHLKLVRAVALRQRERASRSNQRSARPEAHSQRVGAGSPPLLVSSAGGAHYNVQAQPDRHCRVLCFADVCRREFVEAHAPLPRKRPGEAAAERAVQRGIAGGERRAAEEKEDEQGQGHTLRVAFTQMRSSGVPATPFSQVDCSAAAW